MTWTHRFGVSQRTRTDALSPVWTRGSASLVWRRTRKRGAQKGAFRISLFVSELHIWKHKLPFHSIYFYFFFSPPQVVIRIRGRKERKHNTGMAGGEGHSLASCEDVLVTVSLIATETFMAFETRLTSTDQEQLCPRVPSREGSEVPGSPSSPRKRPRQQCGVLSRGCCPCPSQDSTVNKLSRFQSLGQ